MSRQTREEMKRDDRPSRVPVFEANRNKLTVKGLDTVNFEHRWVNDRDYRIAMFKEGGWEVVDKVDGELVGDGGVDQSNGTSSVQTKGVGGGIVSYLMRIPKELYEADQAAKEAEIAQHEADIKGSAENQFRGRVEVNKGYARGSFSGSE